VKRRISLQEQIRLIEQSGSLLPSLSDQVNLLLVISKQKPATFISRTVCKQCPFRGSDRLEEFLVEIKKFLDQLGVFYRVIRRKDAHDFVIIYVASSREILSRILLAEKSNNERELGRCFGYPETAIEAYLGERKRKESFLKTHKHFSYYRYPVRFFAQFMFSEEFYKEEMKSTSLKWLKITKKLSPYLYSEVKNFVESVKICSYKEPK
jgi:hypothetical protein